MLKLQYFGHLRQESTHRKRPWYWERLRTGGEGDSRGWDGWMASPWTWVWANSGRWWRTGSLVCCSPWGRDKKDATVRLNKRRKKEKRRKKREGQEEIGAGEQSPWWPYHLPDILCRRRQWHPTPVLCLENPMDGGAWWAALFNYHEMPEKSESFSCFSYVWLFVTLWTAACQAPLSMGFSRQEWVAIPFSRGSSWPKKELSSLLNYHKMSLS